MDITKNYKKLIKSLTLMNRNAIMPMISISTEPFFDGKFYIVKITDPQAES